MQVTSRWFVGLAVGLAGCTSQQGPSDPPADTGQTVSSERTLSRPQGVVEAVAVPTPWGVAVRDDGLAYFTELANGGVGFTSTKTHAVDGFVATGSLPTGIAFSPDGKQAYVANQAGPVSVLDVASQQVVATIAVEFPLAVLVSPDGNQLFVATGGSTVVVVDVATRTVTRTIEVGFSPNGFAVHPNGRLLYVSNFLAGTVLEIDMSTGVILRTFTVGGTPQEMALDRKGTRLYVANEAGYLNEIALITGQVAPQIPLMGGGFGVGVTPDDAEAYVSIPDEGVVQIFKLQNRRLTKTLRVGGEPRRIAFSQRGNLGAVTNHAGYITFVH
jgi:YVTN family beta-propeller protein